MDLTGTHGIGADLGLNLGLPLHERDLFSSGILGGIGWPSIIGVKANKRDDANSNAFGSMGVGSQYSNTDVMSNRIQQLKNLSNGMLMGKPVQARDIVVNAQVLAQLQDFVSSTANLLRALGKTDGKYLCPSVRPDNC